MTAAVIEADVLAASTPSGRVFTERAGFQIGWLTAVRTVDGDIWIWHCAQCGGDEPVTVAGVMAQGEMATCSPSCTEAARSWFESAARTVTP